MVNQTKRQTCFQLHCKKHKERKSISRIDPRSANIVYPTLRPTGNFLIRNTYCETNKKSSLATQTNISQPYIAWTVSRGRSRTAATSKMVHFVIINNGWKPLAIITKSSILDIAAVLDPPLVSEENKINCTNLARFLYYNYSQTNPDIFFSLYISHDAIQDDVTCSIDVLMTVNFDFCFQVVFHENLE